jgi:hypothetical protein
MRDGAFALEHLLREQGVGSSNLPAPTNEINNLVFSISLTRPIRK